MLHTVERFGGLGRMCSRGRLPGWTLAYARDVRAGFAESTAGLMPWVSPTDTRCRVPLLPSSTYCHRQARGWPSGCEGQLVCRSSGLLNVIAAPCVSPGESAVYFFNRKKGDFFQVQHAKKRKKEGEKRYDQVRDARRRYRRNYHERVFLRRVHRSDVTLP